MALGSSPKSDIAWAAGLFEGEGCITTANKNPRLSLGSTDLDVLEKFLSVVGVGKISKGIRSPIATKDIWVWRTAQFEYVQAVLAAFWPWLCSRRRARAEQMIRLGASGSRGLRFRSLLYTGRCRAGHEMTPENTYTHPTGRVKCRKCGAAYRRAYNAARSVGELRNGPN